MKRPFEEIVAEHGPTVLRVCRALLARPDADDAWSETFLAALRAYPDLADNANIEAWLVTIAHRKAIDVLRAESRRAVPVAMAANLTQTLKAFKDRGVFVLGLDGGGDVQLPGLDLADQPLVIVVGSEGKGLSRIVTETCDAIVSVPITASTESLNAGIAASVTLYEISKLRAERKNQK